MDWARAVVTAALSRAFASGSGSPIFAATVISRESLENIAERFLSCAPLRYMMFLNLLWPAMAVREFLLWVDSPPIAESISFAQRACRLRKRGRGRRGREGR